MNALDVLCAQLTRDLFAIAKFLFLTCRNNVRGYSTGSCCRFHWRWFPSEVVYAFQHRRHVNVSKLSANAYACFLQNYEVDF